MDIIRYYLCIYLFVFYFFCFFVCTKFGFILIIVFVFIDVLCVYYVCLYCICIGLEAEKALSSDYDGYGSIFAMEEREWIIFIVTVSNRVCSCNYFIECWPCMGQFYRPLECKKEF